MWYFFSKQLLNINFANINSPVNTTSGNNIDYKKRDSMILNHYFYSPWNIIKICFCLLESLTNPPQLFIWVMIKPTIKDFKCVNRDRWSDGLFTNMELSSSKTRHWKARSTEKEQEQVLSKYELDIWNNLKGKTWRSEKQASSLSKMQRTWRWYNVYKLWFNNLEVHLGFCMCCLITSLGHRTATLVGSKLPW